MKADWSIQEVELIVTDYLDMLMQELAGIPFNKTDHRRRLRELLSSRTDGSIEKKHQNISAILLELGFPAIDGYKPLKNYQSLLFEAVSNRLNSQENLKREVLSTVQKPVEVPMVDDILTVLEPAPKREPHFYSKSRKVRSKREPYAQSQNADFFELEAKNVALGNSGEEFVIKYEKARLIHSGKEKLAEQIEQVSKTQGPSAGFDIRSFEENGKDRLIEVKTTASGRFTPFYVTKNELLTSQERHKFYQLYRVFLFRSKPGIFALPGRIDGACFLDPIEYLAKIA